MSKKKNEKYLQNWRVRVVIFAATNEKVSCCVKRTKSKSSKSQQHSRYGRPTYREKVNRSKWEQFLFSARVRVPLNLFKACRT
jgi:hypothetical protein